MFILTFLLPLAQPDLRNESKSIHNPGHTISNAMMESEQLRMKKRHNSPSMPIAGQVGGRSLAYSGAYDCDIVHPADVISHHSLPQIAAGSQPVLAIFGPQHLLQQVTGAFKLY